MIVDTFKNRINLAMKLQKMKQHELANKTGINKSVINKYVKGTNRANNENLAKLADALHVSEVWLMGYDVPIDNDYKK